MKKQLLLFTIILFSNFVNGQAHYEPFEFENYSPKWIHLFIDSTIIGDTLFNQNIEFGQDTFIYNGWSQLKSFFDWGDHIVQNDNSIYSLKLKGHSLPEGGFAESIDLETGKSNWKLSYDLRTIPKIELPMHLFINNKGNLEILGERTFLYEDNSLSFLKNNTIAIREYEKETGILSNYNYGNEEDSLVKIIKYPFSYFKSYRTYLYPYNDKYQYIELNHEFKNYGSFILDNNGELVSSTYIDGDYSYHDKYGFADHSLARIRNGKYLGFRLYKPPGSSKDSFDIFIDLIEKDFSNMITTDISDLMDYSNDFSLHSNDENTFIINEYEEDYINNRNLYKHTFKLFDINCNLIETVELKDKNGSPLDINHPRAIKLKYEEGLLIMATGYNFFEDGYSSLNIYKSDGGGNIDTIKVIKVQDENHQLIVDNLYQLTNGDILFEGRDANKIFNDELFTLHGSILIYFPSVDLDIKTSLKDLINKEKPKFKIYPNPVKDILTIKYPEIFTGNIEITDEYGRTIIIRKTQNIKTQNIDVSKLTRGVYLINSFNTKQNLIYNSEKFIKE